ncbi:MAG: AAA family ATPase, partial [Bdellovibrionales bacterium]|nr:AAA family ATPase [Bdellovibrionales bacterium]
RKVMIFLQEHGISTLFAVKIYKQYGEEAISIVGENPYRLAQDFYGVGFFSADKVALALGFAPESPLRLAAAIRHILTAAREQGHCYLRRDQILDEVDQLLKLSIAEKSDETLNQLEQERELFIRMLPLAAGGEEKCYYSKTLYRDEQFCFEWIQQKIKEPIVIDTERVVDWLDRYCEQEAVTLSAEQKRSVQEIVTYPVSILTGGPGCGKTTTTKTLVKLLLAMRKRILLAAPTGRAAQRMGEVIGIDAQTIHRLLVWKPASGGFEKSRDNPLEADFIVVDECSMLDISLSASLLSAVAPNCQLLLVGDADQLPSVGAGNVLKDMIASKRVPCCCLTQIFRQAAQSSIITFAHQINRGEVPKVGSPIRHPSMFSDGRDCLFVDSDEITVEQCQFIVRAKSALERLQQESVQGVVERDDRREVVEVDHEGHLFLGELDSSDQSKSELRALKIPAKYDHVNLEQLLNVENEVEELKAVLKKVHPWSSINFGLSATQMVEKLYAESIPKYLGQGLELQILSPMIRGSRGTHNLNRLVQKLINPAGLGRRELVVGEKLFREHDRVIHRRNNYDLGVFNGDIGTILEIDSSDFNAVIRYKDDRGHKDICYQREDLSEIELAYAITIHKSQGSEFDVVIIPVMTQHYKMLYRNLIYTALTRAKKMAIFVGTRRAFSMAIGNDDARIRQTALQHLLSNIS